MTSSQALAKAREGKRKSDARRRKQYAKDQTAYCLWIKWEHDAWSARCTAEELFGRDHQEFKDADREWHNALRNQPTPPPDHAWT